MKLDKWQEDILHAEGDILLCSGRRIGKTYIFARKAIDKMVSNPKTPIIIVSLTEDQAMIIHFMALHYLQERYPKMLDKGKTTIKRLTLTNESVMVSRPVGDTGDATRGFEGGVLIVDEASRMPKLFWMAAKPILLTTNGEIWMCSTPFGKQGYFWDKFKESYIQKKEHARFKVFYKSTPEVIDERPVSESWTQEQKDGALRILKEDKEEMTDLEYGQEYLGLFLEDVSQFFTEELIKKCCILSKFAYIQNHTYFLGCDVARMDKDEFTFEIIDRTNRDGLIHVKNIVTKNIPIPKNVRRIIELNKQYNFKKEYIDSGNMGITVCDILREDKDNKRKVVEINNASRSIDYEEHKKGILKEDLYNNLKSLMEQGKIQLLNDDNLKASLSSILREYNKNTGRLKIWGSYSHIVEGLIRACWCTKDKSLNPYIF